MVHRDSRKGGIVRWIVWAAALASPLPALAQAVAIGAGYTAPQPIDVAPGQVITVFVQVPGKVAATAVTAQPPLPTTLAGFAIVLRQTFPSDPVAVPILSVADTQSCSEIVPARCELVSMITVQIPFELTPNVPRALMPMNYARLEISYNGTAAATLLLNPMADRIHVLSGCDVIVNLPGGCRALVTRQDGSIIDRDTPAQPGEVLTVSLVGLGRPRQAVPTGTAAPQSAPAVNDVYIGFDARPNQPAMPLTNSVQPNTATLRAGSVGMYEITFTVPSLPDGTPGCTSAVRSNLTVSIGRTASYDGVGICVAVAPVVP
jgi:uncharacterized protein (TIGR03437 family)